MTSHKQIEMIAARWVSRADAPDWSPQEDEQLHAWLAENTAHRVAWLRLKSVWQRADRLAAVRSAEAPRVPRRPHRVLWAMAAALAMMAVLTNVSWLGNDGRYSTDVGGRQTVSLSDGSRLELNTRTVLRAKVTAVERNVWLDKGEAFFDIKPDPKHPFVIHSGDHRVVVLGTKFSVRQEGGRLEVAVLEGRVRVEPLVVDPARPPVIVRGGDLLYSKSAGTLVATNADDKVRRALSWRNGILVFDQSTLEDVAAQFNRYNRRQLVLLDQQTAQTRVGGSFDASGVDAFANLLANGFNLRVDTQDDEIRVSQPH